ncbi:MAG: hypothetical protein OCD02_15695 [Spirochaetaceae bacterium]
MKKIIILLLLIPLRLYSEVQIGGIPALIYENYDEVNLIYDDDGNEIDNTPISKLLTSLTAQFIWTDNRNILLLNIELFGSLGSLDGSFGKDGELSGQLKADTFYQGYYKDSPLYIKFGKYNASLPFGFGTTVTTGQGELGYKSDILDVFYSGIFYSLFNTYNDDGSYDFNSEKYNDDNLIINLLGIDLNLQSNKVLFRLPIEYQDSNFFNSIYPSVNHNINLDFVEANTFVGLAYRDEVSTWAIREEVSINYFNFKTKILGAHLTSNDEITDNYNFTSIDNKNLEFHYGSHFNYLYQEAGNIYGLNSIGLNQSWDKDNINIWLSASSHFTAKTYDIEDREDSFIGTIFSGGLKWKNLWSEDTLFEIYISVLKPEGFSVIEEIQTRDLGFQLVLKLQQIIF